MIDSKQYYTPGQGYCLPGGPVALVWDFPTSTWHPTTGIWHSATKNGANYHSPFNLKGCVQVEIGRGVYRPTVQRKLPFLQWLKKKKGNQDRIGDIANSLCEDHTCPSTSSPRKLLNYLESQSACDGAMESLIMAWMAYKTGFKAVPQERDWSPLKKAYASLAGLAQHHFFNLSKHSEYRTGVGARDGVILGVVIRSLGKSLTLLGIDLPTPQGLEEDTTIVGRGGTHYNALFEALENCGCYNAVLEADLVLSHSYLADDPLMRWMFLAKTGLLKFIYGSLIRPKNRSK